MSDADPYDYTLDELAQLSGFSARNIRSFQLQGMLPPPERGARQGMYGPEHLSRLQLIERLQADGFSRAAISSLMKAWDAGQTLGDVLGFKEELSAFLGGQSRVLVTIEELTERFGVDETHALSTAIKSGLLVGTELDGTFESVNPRLIDIGVELREIDIPLNVALEQASFLRDRCDEIAAHFLNMFMTMVWKPFVDRGSPREELGEVTERLRRLRPLISRSVQAAIDESMAKVVKDFIEDVDLPGTGIS